MAVHDITIRVDSSELFDRLQDMKGDTTALGQRIVEALLTPDHVSFSGAIGMGVYGVEVREARQVDMTPGEASE